MILFDSDTSPLSAMFQVFVACFLLWWSIYWFVFHFRVIAKLNQLQADLTKIKNHLASQTTKPKGHAKITGQ